MKTMMRILAVLMCLLMAVPVFAEGAYAVGATPVAENVNSASFIYRSNLIDVSASGGSYMATIDGTPVTDALYGSFEYQYGYISAAKVDVNNINQDGLFDTAGNIILPFVYGDIEVTSNGEWALAFVLKESTADNYDYKTYDDEYFLIDYVDIYHLPDMAKLTLARENYHNYGVVGNVLNIQDRATGVVTSYDASFTALGTVDSTYSSTYVTYEYAKFRENGQYGYTDAAGNVIMAPAYGYLDLRESYASDYVSIAADSMYGLVRRSTGELLIPAEYDRILNNYYCPSEQMFTGEYNAAGYFAVVAGGKVGYLKEDGTVSAAPKYPYDMATMYGASYSVVDLEGNTILVAADGVETVVGGYQSMYALDFANGVYFKVLSEDYDYGVIDWHGNEVLPCKYSSISISGDGRYVLACEDYSTVTLFELSYPNDGAAAAETAAAPAEAGAADDGIGSSLGNLLSGNSGTETTEETPADEAPAVDEAPAAEEAPAADGAADYSEAAGYLTSAVALLNADPAANGASAAALVETAAALLSGRDDVTSLLTSAVTLLGIDPAANGASAAALIESALALIR